MLPLIITVFVASLLGSMHCVGMCGPLAVMAGGVDTQGRSRSWISWVAYHFGRLVAYSLLGAIAGWLGATLQETGSYLGWQQTATKIAGGSMLVIGLLTLLHLMQGTSHRLWIPKRVQTWLHVGHQWARKQPPVRRAITIGMLTAILPCGWLYSFLLVAAGTAHGGQGALVMATFSLGSVPALVGLVATTKWLVGGWQSAIPWFSAILVTLVGGYTMLQRSTIDLSSLNTASAVSAETSLVEHIEELPKKRLPCCEPKTDEAKVDEPTGTE